MKSLIIAHRGASGEAPGNTMAAFRLALEQGAEGLELDIQRTIDGELMVIHDETLNRTSNGTGYVASHTAKYIRQLDASFKFRPYQGEKIPYLREVLELIAGTPIKLNIELKNNIIMYEGMEEAVVQMIQDYGLSGQIILSSFNHESVRKLSELAPQIEGALLYSSSLWEPWVYAEEWGAKGLHPHYYLVTPLMVELSHRAGLKVRPYTVNKDKDIKRMLEAGVDAIITNYPAKMKQIRTAITKTRR